MLDLVSLPAQNLWESTGNALTTASIAGQCGPGPWFREQFSKDTSLEHDSHIPPGAVTMVLYEFKYGAPRGRLSNRADC